MPRSSIALLPKGNIADRGQFIDQKVVELESQGQSKTEASLHAAGVGFNRLVEEFANETADKMQTIGAAVRSGG